MNGLCLFDKVNITVLLNVFRKMDYLQWDAEVAVRMPFTAGLDFDIERVIYEGKDYVTCELVPV
jgi:hypothetical protein